MEFLLGTCRKFSAGGGVWIYLKPCSSTNVKSRILFHDRRLRYRFFHCVYSLEACTNGWWYLEQNDAGITSDVATFIQAKQIEMKCPEEFSNPVDRLGRLHIWLKYLYVVGKKFRFYSSDLENISVFGLMIYITIFLMILDNLTFPHKNQSGVKFVFGLHFRRSFFTIRDSSEKIQQEIRSAWTEVSSNNMLTITIRTFIHHKGRECLRRAFFGAVIHSDHKRPKVGEKDSWIFSEIPQ